MIDSVYSPGQLSPCTILVLISAVYLRALWKIPFDPKEGIFHLVNGAKTSVMFMSAHMRFLHHKRSGGLRVMTLEQKGEETMVTFMLPPEGPDELSKLEASLTATALDELLEQSTRYGVQFEIKIPKCKLSGNVDLIPHLRAMGIRSLFEGADLTGLTKGHESQSATNAEQKAAFGRSH